MWICLVIAAAIAVLAPIGAFHSYLQGSYGNAQTAINAGLIALAVMSGVLGMAK